jgi:hypothetical protein
MFDVLKHRSSPLCGIPLSVPSVRRPGPCRPLKQAEIAKRTQFYSQHSVLQTLTTKKFLFLPKANLMMYVCEKPFEWVPTSSALAHSHTRVRGRLEPSGKRSRPVKAGQGKTNNPFFSGDGKEPGRAQGASVSKPI